MACFQAVPFLVFRTFPQIVEVLTSVTYNQSMNTNLAIAEKSSPVYSMNLSLVNGTFAEVQLVANAVGVERGRNDPRTVAEQDGILYVLSECCAAGAKGSFTTDEETGAELPTIVCRNCYHEINEDSGRVLSENEILRVSPADLYLIRANAPRL